MSDTITVSSVFKQARIKLSDLPKIAVKSVLKHASDITSNSGLRCFLNAFPPDEKRGFAATPTSACLGLILGIHRLDKRSLRIFYLAILASGFDGRMTDATQNTITGNCGKWSRESVISGKKEYASDYKHLEYFQSKEFAPLLAYFRKLYAAIDKLQTKLEQDAASKLKRAS